MEKSKESLLRKQAIRQLKQTLSTEVASYLDSLLDL